MIPQTMVWTERGGIAYVGYLEYEQDSVPCAANSQYVVQPREPATMPSPMPSPMTYRVPEIAHCESDFDVRLRQGS